MTTWKQFRDAVAILTAAFPKLGPDESTVKVWFALLRDLPAVALERAVIMFCQTTREIYPGTNVVASLRELACPDSAPASWMAWKEVSEGLRGPSAGGVFNVPQEPVFSHVRIREAVDALGGWFTLANSDALGVERAHFIKAYEQLSDQGRLPRLVATPKALPVNREVVQLVRKQVVKEA